MSCDEPRISPRKEFNPITTREKREERRRKRLPKPTQKPVSERTAKFTSKELEEYVAKGAHGVVLKAPVPCTMNRSTMYTLYMCASCFRKMPMKSTTRYKLSTPMQLFTLHILKKCDLDPIYILKNYRKVKVTRGQPFKIY